VRSAQAGRGAWYPRWFWPSFAAPSTLWLLLFFVVPFYVILAVAFGGQDPIFLTPVPTYNPVRWNPSAFTDTVSQLVTRGTITQHAFINTLAYVAVATMVCLVLGYPVAYFIARHAGRFKPAFLIAFVAPFWISYMMRMFAWVNLLQGDGYVNRILSAFGLIDQPVQWLTGRPLTVVLGLVYGYIPFMILPLYATLDRVDSYTLEASRDLGAGQVTTFLRVTLPLSRQAILAGCIIVTLPMFGDYFTQTLLSASPKTAMLGNIIVSSLGSSLVKTGASLVVILMALLILPMLYYLRSTTRARELAER
jgi:ABC-type spermidine/putrescine transport system permease subunit I